MPRVDFPSLGSLTGALSNKTLSSISYGDLKDSTEVLQCFFYPVQFDLDTDESGIRHLEMAKALRKRRIKQSTEIDPEKEMQLYKPFDVDSCHLEKLLPYHILIDTELNIIQRGALMKVRDCMVTNYETGGGGGGATQREGVVIPLISLCILSGNLV